MSYEGDYSPFLTGQFTKASGIAVDVQSLPWTAAHEKLLTAHAGGSLPDVLMLPASWVSEFAMIGAISPVPGPHLLADLFPGIVKAVTVAGKTFALPWSVAPQVQFFRRDLFATIDFEAPPTDWQGWRNAGLALKRRRPEEFYALLYLNWPDALMTFAGQAGASLLREGASRGAFRSPEFRAALSFYKSLFDDGLAPRALSTEVQDPLAAFAQGYFAVYPSGPALLVDLRRRAAEISPSRWGVARMPGPNGPGPAGGISASLAVSAKSRRPRDAWALVEHLTSVESELRFQALIGNLPARQSAWASPQLRTLELASFTEQIRTPFFEPSVIEWQRIKDETQLIAERVVRGLLTIDQGVAEMDRRADLLLSKRRSLVQAGRLT